MARLESLPDGTCPEPVRRRRAASPLAWRWLARHHLYRHDFVVGLTLDQLHVRIDPRPCGRGAFTEGSAATTYGNTDIVDELCRERTRQLALYVSIAMPGLPDDLRAPASNPRSNVGLDTVP